MHCTEFIRSRRKKKGFIIIIDEWDCLFRIAKEDTAAQRRYLDFLRDLLKDRVYVKVAYMTGILPIKKYGTHSALNIFDEYSMTNSGELAEYFGFTETEVEKLCKEYHKDFKVFKAWYDGYRLSDNQHIYNPKSVIDGMQSNKMRSFWTNTETYEALQIYIDMDMDGLKQSIIEMLGGRYCEIDAGSFLNDMTTFKSKDDILTLLVHLGYLAYDETRECVYIPNAEVREEFVRALKNGRHTEIVKFIQDSEVLLNAGIAQRDSLRVS